MMENAVAASHANKVPAVCLHDANRLPYFGHILPVRSGQVFQGAILRPPSPPTRQRHRPIPRRDHLAALVGDGDVNVDEVPPVLLALAGDAA
jgi:hypothetical protein